MNRLAKLIAPAIAASLVLGAAVPASAASWQGRDSYRQEIAQLDRQIDRAQERRLISQREADRLERKVDQLQNLHARYAKNGLTRTEERILDQRIDSVKRQIAAEVADRDRAPQGRPGDHRR
ncbi:hypothetical protein [Erythrobacter sp. SG61-1L]|uniref:hypothetical protein n=1 Tax=Erythrobacter sp. SG61-1L TaxID=1603897 RepID=UPI0006C8FD30|nr:hypothetical protein [Erythrobacter sp. SG61-1L]